MNTNKKLNLLAWALSASAAFVATPGQAFDLTGKSYVQYGDAQSYSLPILAIQDGCTNPGCAYYVASSPGAIKGLTVLGTGSGGQQVISNFNGMDNAYSTPNGTNSAPYWAPSAATSNGTQGTVQHNGANTWDSSLSALQTYLAGQSMIFFFNNNQTSSGGAFDQSLAAWAQITVKDASGAAIGIYDLTNRGTTAGVGGKYAPVTAGGGGTFNGNVANYTSSGAGPVAGNRASTDYVLSGGQICLDSTGQVPVDCATPGASAPINHNLGANQAAYAILFPELNAQLNSLFGTLSSAQLANYTMSVDVRLGCDPATLGGPNGPICNGGVGGDYGRDLNSGYEQIFISTARDVVNTPVPEPGTLALVGMALFALGRARRRSVAR
ncbi:PEP-CTERM sorting domain-containing protein [Pelomonas sp. KK5]|uniref:PEP-CTERM sorting domain-containing protein n=1 Tax=Pelomonas sp. KK5 TaxID=1855730 RepID=UPI0011807729|nr:PEP-CTERM sorting domain-containing protein [Pelomonas sp. KK5]